MNTKSITKIKIRPTRRIVRKIFIMLVLYSFFNCLSSYTKCYNTPVEKTPMATEIFSADEKKFIKKLIKWGLIIVVAIAVLSGLSQVINVYQTEGSAGLKRLVTDGEDLATLQAVNGGKKVESIVGIQSNTGELPLSIEVPSLGIQSNIQSPVVQTVKVLDDALNRGPVYYQGSGTPGERNMLVFGHSTGFSIVRNKAYQVFNNIKKAQVGSYIYIRTTSGVHTYKTVNVRRASKYSTWVDFNSSKPMLTLATCDSFGKASDRWVLEAEYIGFEKR